MLRAVGLRTGLLVLCALLIAAPVLVATIGTISVGNTTDDLAAVGGIAPASRTDIDAQLSTAAAATRRALWAAAGVAVVVGTGLAVWTTRSITSAVQREASTLDERSSQLRGVADSIRATAEDVAARAGSASTAGEQVSGNVQAIAAAVDELSASVREIAVNAGEASTVASAAVGKAEATNVVIGELGASSAEIGKVIDVITSIAEQTNLLALNATIEAARAGEAGKGFAVVAGEVKELAKETAEATEEIAGRVSRIQAETEGAVGAIAEITEIIGRISDLQTTIASAVEEQDVTTDDIARNLQEVVRGSSQIAESVSEVARNAKGNSGKAGSVQETASAMCAVAVGLQALLDRQARRASCTSSPDPQEQESVLTS